MDAEGRGFGDAAVFFCFCGYGDHRDRVSSPTPHTADLHKHRGHKQRGGTSNGGAIEGGQVSGAARRGDIIYGLTREGDTSNGGAHATGERAGEHTYEHQSWGEIS